MPPDGMERVVHEIRSDVREVRKLILGNGSEGIITRLSHLERTDREMRKQVDALVKAEPRSEPEVAIAKWTFWGKVVGVGLGSGGLVEVLSRLFL